MSILSDTIIAQCTPRGAGALALLRLSGSQAVEIATRLSALPAHKKLIDQSTHTIHFGWVINEQGDHVDQVLFLLMRGPNSFTGEDVVEITCHNNPFIIQAIIDCALACGARMAYEGEFSKRAMLNGKIDLIQAESINELIHANNQLSLKKALAQLEGSFSHWLAGIEKELVKALALSEASFEFIDEEDLSFADPIKTIIQSTRATINTLKHTFDQQQQIRQGVRIAIIGSVNAGKSSLFNALLGKDRAIVTNIAGTTRDVIEAGVYQEDAYWTLIDTAGLRQTDDVVEKEGIKRSFAEAEQADIILLVVDSSRELCADEYEVYQQLHDRFAAKTIVIASKSDLPRVEQTFLSHRDHVTLCSDHTEDVHNITTQLTERVKRLLSSCHAPFLLNQRQYNVMLSLEKKLITLQEMLEGDIAYELVSYHLNDALTVISELTGKSIAESAMDAVFKQFCVGK